MHCATASLRIISPNFNDAGALALEMGHTDTGMIFAHYRELVCPKDAGAFWKIAPERDGKVVSIKAA